MDMAKQIEDQIRNAIDVSNLTLINESEKHAGHAGDNGTGQTHFKLMVVSNDFSGLTRVQRQKLIMQQVKGLFSQGLHALSMTVKTPSE